MKAINLKAWMFWAVAISLSSFYLSRLAPGSGGGHENHFLVFLIVFGAVAVSLWSVFRHYRTAA